jgi:hypothetical protein
VSEPALSLAFHDPERGLHGAARSGITLLWEGTRATAVPDGPELTEAKGEARRAVLEDRFDLRFEPVTEPAALGGTRTAVCRVEGEALGRRIQCLGTMTETLEPPAWAELDAIRSLACLVDAEHALLVVARRPRGAPAHGQELIRGAIIDGGELLVPEDVRLSTVYNGGGRQRSAGLELWLPQEDFPRRAFGTAVAGTSLELEGLRVNAAVFRWRMEGREGTGGYDVMVRAEPPSAA